MLIVGFCVVGCVGRVGWFCCSLCLLVFMILVLVGVLVLSLFGCASWLFGVLVGVIDVGVLFVGCVSGLLRCVVCVGR